MLKEVYTMLTAGQPCSPGPFAGIFYAIDGRLVSPDFCRWPVNTARGRVETAYDGYRAEHRDMWDELIRVEYPDVAERVEDDHKALPRGRVGLSSKAGEPAAFLVTACPCLDTDDFRVQIIDTFRLAGYPVEFSFGTMNYVCRECGSGSV